MSEKQITFSWSNYIKPTPKNLQRIARFVRGLFVFLTSLSAFEAIKEKNAWWTIVPAVTGYILDHLIEFFGEVDVEARRQITFDIPENTPVTMTDEIVSPGESGNS